MSWARCLAGATYRAAARDVTNYSNEGRMTRSQIAEFDIGFEANSEVAASMREFNSALMRLAGRRLERIAIAGPLRKSKLAWMVATHQQPVLYRVVMLGSACALCWNAGNVLCAHLAARALIETVALLLEFERELQEPSRHQT
jgi:hypothetical protein